MKLQTLISIENLLEAIFKIVIVIFMATPLLCISIMLINMVLLILTGKI